MSAASAPRSSREIKEEVVELLALVGPDLGERVRQYCGASGRTQLPGLRLPSRSCSPVARSPDIEGFLAEVTEAYYIDDEADGWVSTRMGSDTTTTVASLRSPPGIAVRSCRCFRLISETASQC